MSARDISAAQSDALLPVRFQSEVIANMTATLLAEPSPPCLLRSLEPGCSARRPATSATSEPPSALERWGLETRQNTVQVATGRPWDPACLAWLGAPSVLESS